MAGLVRSVLFFAAVFAAHFFSEREVLCAKGLTRNPELGLAYANFVNHQFHYLNVSQVGSYLVHELGDCTAVCVRSVSCFSFNVAAHPDINDHILCELLASDKYNSSAKFKPNPSFNHYSIFNPCSEMPCMNGGTCIALYFTDDFKCKCPPEFKGRSCKIDVDECIENKHNCSANATCENTQGSFKCTCNHGYQGVNCNGSTSRYGLIQDYQIKRNGNYKIKAAGARGGIHTYSYEWNPGTYYGGKGAVMSGIFYLVKGTVLKIVEGKRGGNSVEVQDGQSTTQTAASLGLSIEDNAGTGGGGGSFVYKSDNTLLIAAGGGGGASSGYNGVDGQSGTSGASSVGSSSSSSRAGGSSGQPGLCNSAGGNYHGGVGAGWLGQGCARAAVQHGERGGSHTQGWVGGRAGSMNSGYNGGPAPGAVGGFGGGGGGSEDNGASGGGGGYSGGGSGTHPQQAGGGGGSYCAGFGSGCSGVTGGNSADNGFVKITEL